MSENIELLQRLEDAAVRRCWLLAKALEDLPLDRAIELARTAEAFVTGAESPSAGGAAVEQPPDARSSISAPQVRDTSAPAQPASRKRTTLALSNEKREELLDQKRRSMIA
jgi:hypothetical protein